MRIGQSQNKSKISVRKENTEYTGYLCTASLELITTALQKGKSGSLELKP